VDDVRDVTTSAQGEQQMIEVGRTCDVSASPSAVWALLADFATISSWAVS
jgi:hypothetical protein